MRPVSILALSMWAGHALVRPPPTIDRIASRSRSSLCGKSLRMRVMGASLPRTIGDRHLEAEARDEATDRSEGSLRLRALPGAFKCRWRTNGRLMLCCPTPIRSSRSQPSGRALGGNYLNYFNHLRKSARLYTDLARRLQCRSPSTTLKFNPTQLPQHSLGELKCWSKI